MRQATATVFLLAALLVAVAWPADRTEVRSLVEHLPGRCRWVAGTPDVAQTVAALRWWPTEPLGAEALEEEGAALLTWALDMAPQALRGPAVIAQLDDGALLFLGATPFSRAEIAELLRPRQPSRAVEDILVLSAGRRNFSLVVRSGEIVGCSDFDQLRRFLAKPVEAAQSILAAPEAAALLGRPELGQASAFLFKPRIALPPAAGRDTGQAALFRQLNAATGIWDTINAPWLILLHLERREIIITAASPAAGTPAATFSESRAMLSPGLTAIRAGFPIFITYNGPNFAALFRAIEQAEETFDPDVGTEFHEEMAELNRELGYDFHRDFLAVLGGEWAVGINPGGEAIPRRGKNVEWVFICGVADGEKFIKRAARLAQVAREPWAAGETYRGARCFRTRAFGVPLEVGLSGNSLLVASSSGKLREAIDHVANLPARVAGAREIAAPAALELRLGMESWALARLLPGSGPRWARVASDWSTLRLQAEAVAKFQQVVGQRELQLRLEGITPESLSQWLLPLVRRR